MAFFRALRWRNPCLCLPFALATLRHTHVHDHTPCSRYPAREEGVNTEWYSKQIFRTRAESQRIVAARPLCRLQYPVRAKSSAKDFPLTSEIVMLGASANHVGVLKETNGYAPALGKTQCILSRVTSMGNKTSHLA